MPLSGNAPKATPSVSSALLAAQQKLLALRQQYKEKDALTEPSIHNGRSPQPTPDYQTVINELPPHLGWHSNRATQLWRQAPPTPTASRLQSQQRQQLHSTVTLPLTTIVEPNLNNASIKLYPDLAMAWLKHKKVTVARVWLLLRHLDQQGQGWVEKQEATQQLTEANSPWRICGKRQLRNLWQRGEGLFWRVENGRIWLRSTAKVAHELDVERLTGNPIALPLSLVTGKLGTLRAHLYASFHSGRRQTPIARDTLKQLCDITGRSQRRYEKIARVNKTSNFAIGPNANSIENRQQEGWQRGNALFTFIDHRGKHGAPGRHYLAWQLPNSYEGPHRTLARGQQKRLNQKLTDLSNQGMTGNSQSIRSKRFFGNAQTAVKANSKERKEVYWGDACERRQNGRFNRGQQLWYYLPQSNGDDLQWK